VVNDQWGSPTWAGDLADALARIITGPVSLAGGIYHYTNEGIITWFDFAREIYAQGRKRGLLTKECRVLPCTSEEFPSPVKRPAWSVLDKTKLRAALGITIPPWDESLSVFLHFLQLKQKEAEKESGEWGFR